VFDVLTPFGHAEMSAHLLDQLEGRCDLLFGAQVDLQVQVRAVIRESCHPVLADEHEDR